MASFFSGLRNSSLFQGILGNLCGPTVSDGPGLNDLPLLPQAEIIDKLSEGRDLFAVAICSQHLNAVIKNLHIQPESVNVRITSKEPTICIVFDKKRYCTWKVIEMRKLCWTKCGRSERLVLGGAEFIFRNSRGYPSTVLCYTQSPPESLGCLLKFLLSLFPKTGFYKMTIDVDIVQRQKEFSWKIPLDKTEKLTLSGDSVRVEIVRDFVKALQCDNLLRVRSSITGPPECFLDLNVSNLVLTNASFLTPTHLMFSKSSVIIAKMTQFTTTDLLIFLEWWLRSDNNRLKYIALGHVGEAKYNWQTVVQSMRAQQWNPGDREEGYIVNEGLLKMETVDCKNGWDLKRGDLLATLLFDTHFFGFFVWHDRYPSKKNTSLN